MRRLAAFALPFGAAAALYVYLLSPAAGLILCALCLLGAALCLWLRPAWKRTSVAALGLAVGFLWSCAYELLFLQPVWQVSGQTMALTAQVRDYPTQTDYGCKVTVGATINGRRVKILLYLDDTAMTLEPGDTVSLQAELKRSVEGMDEDETLWYQSKGIQLLAYGRSQAAVTRAEKTPVFLLPVVFAGKLRQTIFKMMPEDTTGYLQALLTGDKSGLSYSQISQMNRAGVSHTVAISGMHVSILLTMLYFLLGKNQRLTALIGIPLALCFALMTGASPSVVRATVMQLILLLAPIFGRENDPLTSMCAALLLILGQNPWAVSNVSFQLSFAAVAGILLLMSPLQRWMRRPKWVQRLCNCKWTRGITRFLIGGVATTLGALAFTVPICAACFGTVSLYAPLTNVLILWVVSIVFTAGLICCLAGLVWLPAGRVLGWLLAWPIRYILAVTEFVSNLPFAAVYTASVYIVLWLFCTYGILALCLTGKKKPAALSCGCVSVCLAAAVALTAMESRPRQFHITALDVGQGQSICMQSGDFSALMDCGGSKDGEAGEAAARLLTAGGTDELDCLILSHYDDDHINGVEQLFSRLHVETLYLPDVEPDTDARRQIEALAAENETRIVYVTEDMTLPFDGGSLQIFAPVSSYDENAACLSVLYTAGEYDMLITADMDKYAEYALMESHALPDVELYVAGHHGSKYSTSAELLDTIQPETVLISVGRNSFGHPAQEVLERCAEAGAEVYRTDLCGNITIGR